MVHFLAIALVSAATLLLELALLRLFAVQQFYHFAFMAVSLALLGAGASGSLLSVWRRRPASSWLCLAFSLTSVGAYLVINNLPFDSFSIAWDGRQVGFLALYFLVIAIPFLFSGLLVGEELMAAGRDGATGSHRVYAANLIGSGLGSLASLAALDAFGGEGAVILAAVLGAAAGLLFPVRATSRGAAVALFSLGLLALIQRPAALSQNLSPYKTLSVLSQALDAHHVLTAWDARARIDVVESSTIHVMPGLSLLSPVGPPSQAGLMLDGDGLMPINKLSPGSEEAAVLDDYLPGGIAHRLRPNGRTLVLEAGTGTEVLFALAGGANQVTAVEENKLILETIMGPYDQVTGGLYHDGRVNVVNQSSRVFARRSGSDHYDLVILALNDPHRPVTSGAYSLTENYDYTVEAIGDYLELLADDGLLLISRWLQTPPSESARLFATMAEALAASGRRPGDHLMAFRSLRTMTVIASASPLTAGEVDAARRFLKERGFDGVYYPGIHPEDVNHHNVLPEAAYYRLFRAILEGPEAVFDEYRFDIRPSTDNHPFFFHFFKWRQTPEILAGLGRTWQPFGGSGFFVLVALLLLVGLASAVFIVGPLLWRATGVGRLLRGKGRWGARVFFYFAALGLAFLFVEIPLAQRFILILGQPVTALAVVIFSLLLSSGLGSLTVRRWSLRWGLASLVLVTVLYPLFLELLLTAVLPWPFWARALASALALAPLGYLMGLPFAGGLRLVEERDPALVPWCWAINGSFSVMSAVLAIMVALTWGFAVVLWLGAAAYALALLAFGRFPPGAS